MTDSDDRDDTISKLQEEIESLKSENKPFEKIFTENQIEKLKNPKKRATWSTKDIAKAIVIHSAGARAYRLLLKKGYPLPKVSTLKEWSKKIKFEPGILKQVFMIIKKTDLTNLQKVCVLSFGEIKVRSVFMYDKVNDEILKPYKYVQVAVLRGLFDNWKQPIFFDYDCQMTKDKLFEIIKFTEKAGFPVVAIVSDLDGGNRGLYQELNISISQTWFNNPANNKKIYVFAHAPHLIKLLRNHFIGQGFILNGKEINKDIIEKLILITKRTDLNIAHEISMESLQVKGAEGQKVTYPTKLFSHTISKAISQCGTLGKYHSENWIECAEFFKDVNDWFDCLNVRAPVEDTRNSIKAFGLSLDLQTSILDKMNKVITDLKIKGRTGLPPFQKGILITNTSLKILFDDLKTRYDIKYILTCRLNQNAIQNFFGATRSKQGLYDDPNSLEFKYQLRSYILGKNEGSLSNAGSVEQYKTPDLETNKEILLTEQCFRELASPVKNNHNDTDPLITELDELVVDDLKNLAGFICHKLQKDEPSASSSNQETFTWPDYLFEGDLKRPSEKLLTELQKLDQIFNNVNLDSLLVCKGYLSHLITLASHVDCSIKIKTLFFKSRMYLRMRVINKDIQDQSFSRKRKMSTIV